MVGPPVVSPGVQGQGFSPPTPPIRQSIMKDATGAVLRATERELAFTLKIPNSTANLGKVHKAFIDDLFRATENEATLLPSNDRTTPVPDSIREPKDFPKTDPDHRAFFRRHANQRDTLVFHTIITSLSIDELKKRMLLNLQANNLWMTNESLKSKEMAVIAFVWKAPARLLHRPSFAKKINDYLGKIELNFEQQSLLKRASEDAELPELPQVFINIRSFKHGNTNRVETEAPAILAPKSYSRLMKELVSQIPFDAIGYEIVPSGMVAKIGEENYRKALIANNDYNNCIRVIEILYMHKSHFDLTVTYNNETGTIGDWFTNSPLIIDVQPTNRSEEIGKYFVIVEECHIVQARREVAALLRVFQNNDDAYGSHYPRFPCIANGPLADGAAERTAESLAKKFASLQADTMIPNSQKPAEELTAWSPSRSEVVFDWQSTREFPSVSQELATPAKSPPNAIDDMATQARSAYTNDIETTVSELKTVVTESIAAQSRMLQQFMHTSQQQQQQLMESTQIQQATTNQLLQHLSSIMAHLVNPNLPTGVPPPPLPIFNRPSPPSDTSTVRPPTPTAPPPIPISTHQTPSTLRPASQKSPNKRQAPADASPDRRRGSSPTDSDTQMFNADHDPDQTTADATSAPPLLDPDPGRPM
jgi:hypothetical protein